MREDQAGLELFVLCPQGLNSLIQIKGEDNGENGVVLDKALAGDKVASEACQSRCCRPERPLAAVWENLSPPVRAIRSECPS